MYHRSNEVGKINTWEYFFRQPTDLSLEDAYDESVLFVNRLDCPDVFSDRYRAAFNDAIKDDWLFTISNRAEWRRIYHQYMRLSEDIADNVESLWNKNVNSEDRVLGVLMRGTD